MQVHKMILREVLGLLLVVFGINALWEAAQTPLYASTTLLFGTTTSSLGDPRYWLILLLATLGDVFYITCIYIFVALIERDLSWIKRPLRIRPLLILLLTGLVVATCIEWRGLSEGRWIYSAAMPIVPYIRVGLSPFVQLSSTALISITAFRLSMRFRS
jgi:amino acid transporter